MFIPLFWFVSSKNHGHRDVEVEPQILPSSFVSKEVTKKQYRGWIDYRMIEEKDICCIIWKDKNEVVLLSTHIKPTSPVGLKQFVYRRIRKEIKIRPIHLQYLKTLRGVDRDDQLCVVYISLTRSHKWWHRVFFYLLDISIYNAWIVYNDVSFRLLEKPLTHLSFQLQLRKELLVKWTSHNEAWSIVSLDMPSIHSTLSMGNKQGNCIICGHRTN